MVNQTDRKKLIWLLKRASSITAWQRFSDACDAFAKAFEYAMTNAAPEPQLRNPTAGMPDTEGYKVVVDAQINFSKGLAKLANGDRSGFRFSGELDLVSDLRSKFQRVFGLNPDQVGDYVNFDQLNRLFMAFCDQAPGTAFRPKYKNLVTPPAAPLLRLQNFPASLPEPPEPPQDVLVKTGDPIPTYGIWEPVKLLSGPKSASDSQATPFWHRLMRTTSVGEPAKYELEIIAAPAYLQQGDKAPGADLDENASPLAKPREGSPVIWRLLWADDRYVDGVIPAEEADYFAASLSDSAASTSRLRCEAGVPCPREGEWSTPAAAGSRRFKSGEMMPELGGDYGKTIWYLKEQMD
jgi:hypothetical protein